MAQTTVLTLLNAVRATGDGPTFNVMYPWAFASVQAEISVNATSCVINVMARISGSTFDTLCVLDLGEGYLSGEIQPISFPALVREIKANISSLSTLAPGNPGWSVYFAIRDSGR